MRAMQRQSSKRDEVAALSLAVALRQVANEPMN
jgi:hypothetical protein